MHVISATLSDSESFWPLCSRNFPPISYVLNCMYIAKFRLLFGSMYEWGWMNSTPQCKVQGNLRQLWGIFQNRHSFQLPPSSDPIKLHPGRTTGWSCGSGFMRYRFFLDLCPYWKLSSWQLLRKLVALPPGAGRDSILSSSLTIRPQTPTPWQLLTIEWRNDV